MLDILVIWVGAFAILGFIIGIYFNNNTVFRTLINLWLGKNIFGKLQILPAAIMALPLIVFEYIGRGIYIVVLTLWEMGNKKSK